ncbi:MAG: DHH family phosphoesterase [Gemmataceae bacterium]
MPLDWTPFLDLVRRHQRFLLLTHVRPDADALGSQIGMADLLQQLGKSARIVIGSSFPERYRFLDPHQQVERFAPGSDGYTGSDAVIVLDTGTWNQLGDCGPPLKERNVPKLVIDHHRTQDELGAARIVDIAAEATGRLVCTAFELMQKTPTPAAAEALFAALAMDTGWFRHSSTGAETFELAAKLARWGANPTRIYDELYERNSVARMRLQGRVLDRITLAHGGRVAYSEVYLSDFGETGAHPLDTEDFVQLLRSLEGVEIGVLLIEQIKGEVKVSFRSRGNVDVSKIAERFGGGGHRPAAGATLPGTIAEARARVLAALGEQIQK